MTILFRKLEDGSHFQSHRNWIRHYRSCQLLIGILNGYVRRVILPASISVISILLVIFNFILIRMKFDMYVFSSAFVADFDMSLFLLMVFSRGWRLFHMYDSALENRRKKNKSSGIEKRELRGLRMLRLGIGSTGFLDLQSSLTLYAAILNYTVSLLCMFWVKYCGQIDVSSLRQ